MNTRISHQSFQNTIAPVAAPSVAAANSGRHTNRFIPSGNGHALQTRLRTWRNDMGGCVAGRILLHSLCIVSHPRLARWHWQGIVREFSTPSTSLY